MRRHSRASHWIVSVGIILVFLVSSIGSPALASLGSGTTAGPSASSSSGGSYSKVPAQLPTILVQAKQIGMLNPSTPMSVQIVLPLSNPLGLSNELTDLYSPSSSSYHQFLSLAQFAQLFGPSPAELVALTDYMQSKGLQVQQGGSFSTDLVTIKGTAQQVENAFKVQIGLYKYDGQSFYSAVSPPQLPETFSNVQMVYGLQNYATSTGNPVPLFRIIGPAGKSQTTSSYAYYSPSEIKQVYNATSLYSEGYNGKGITIAIVDAYGDPYIQEELNAFDSQFNLPATTVNVICVDGPCNYYNGITTGWNGEIALDVEWAHAMAPGATIDLYIASTDYYPLYEAVQQAVSNSSTNIVSMSWAEPENDLASSASVAPVLGENYPWLDQVFQEAAAVGITCLASSGDWGAYEQSLGQTSLYGGAMYPSTDPYVTGVGGTSLFMNTTSGLLQFPYANATGGYGTETAWSWNNYYGWGTGGGESTLFARPEWQTGLGTSGLEMRGAPDIAWDADPQTGVIVNIEGEFWVVGGTSVGSPSLAGSLATLEQKAGERLGLINPTLYSILNSPTEYAKAFHDITVGNNNPNSATPGWDPLTGVGSPNLGELANYLAPTGSINVIASSNISLGSSAPYVSNSKQVAIGIYANATYGGASVTTGTGSADIVSPNGALLGEVTMSYNSTSDLWFGSYTIKSTDPPGSWTATVYIVDGAKSGMGSTTFSVGDGVTLFEPRTILFPTLLQLGQTVPVSAVVTEPNGTIVSSGTYTAVFTFQNATGRVEGKIPLTFDKSAGSWNGSFGVPPTADQGAWVLTVNGTDWSGNRGSTYSWLNVGLEVFVYTFNEYGEQTPTFVIDDIIAVFAVPVYADSLVTSGSFYATISSGATVLGKVPLSYNAVEEVWNGNFTTGPTDPTGFYNITVSGNNGFGNAGSSSTVVRVAPYDLTVGVSASPTSIFDVGSSVLIKASVTYPDAAAMKVGYVDGYVLYYYYGFLYEVGEFLMTYNSASGGFVGSFSSQGPLYTPPGQYLVYVNALDPAGNSGWGTGPFEMTVAPSITLSPSFDATGTSVTITGVGFVASHALTVTYDGSTTGMPKFCTTDAYGNVGSGCAFTVPSSSLPGPHTIAVSDGTSKPTATFTVTLLGVECLKSTLVVGSATMCTATVKESGLVAPTGIVTWQPSSNGSVGFCTLSHHTSSSTGACTVKFIPTIAGPDLLMANYSGDSNNPATYGAYDLTVTMKATKTAVSCAPRSTVVGLTTTIACEARVTGYLPTGTVSWFQSGAGSVYFTSTTCTLSLGACFVTMTAGTTAGEVTIEGTYSGDYNNQGSYGVATLTIAKAPTVTVVSCAESSLSLGTPTACTATVTSGYPSLTGTVAWSKVSGSGTGMVTFTSEACTQSSPGTLSCAVTVTATKSGSVAIKAAYSGDSNTLKSSGKFSLAVNP